MCRRAVSGRARAQRPSAGHGVRNASEKPRMFVLLAHRSSWSRCQVSRQGIALYCERMSILLAHRSRGPGVRQAGRAYSLFFCAGLEVKSSRGRVCSFAWGLVTHSAAVSWLQLSYFGDLSNTIQTHVNLLSTLTMSTSSHPTSTESSARADSPRGGLALRPATRSRLGASAGRTMAEELRNQLAAALEARCAHGALTQQEAELLRTLTHPPLPSEWLAGSQAAPATAPRVDASEPTWAERAAGGPRQAAGAAGAWQGRLAAALGRLVVAVGVGRLALAVVGCGATLGRLGLRVARARARAASGRAQGERRRTSAGPRQRPRQGQRQRPARSDRRRGREARAGTVLAAAWRLHFPPAAGAAGGNSNSIR